VVMVDFEQAEIASINLTWNDTIVKGCQFHLLQAVIRKWRILYGKQSSKAEKEVVDRVRILSRARVLADFEQNLAQL
jgi:hypothetical protein